MCVRTKEAGSLLPRDQEENTRRVATVIFKCAGELRGPSTKWIGFQKWGTEPPRPPAPSWGGLASHHPDCTQTPGGAAESATHAPFWKATRHTRRVPHAGGGTQGGPRIRKTGTCGSPTALRTKFPPEERGLLRTHS